MHLTLAPFSDRINFATWLNEQNLVGQAVEVGTHRGEFAEVLMTTWQGDRLFCVDPYLSGYDPEDPASCGDRGEDMKIAQSKLQRFRQRVVFLQQTSRQAALSTLFETESLDFVYIDGHHRYEYVLDDLLCWWYKVKVGGVLAGHDIFLPNDPHWEEEIQPAVFRFAELVQRKIYLVTAPGTDPWSFYLVK